MPKKSYQRRKRTTAFQCKVVGRYLVHLYDSLQTKPTTDWLISKNQLNDDFRMFIALPENADIAECRGSSLLRGGIGSLLDNANYLIDMEKESKYFRINHEKFRRHCVSEEVRKILLEKITIGTGNSAHRMPNRTFFKKLYDMPQFLPPMEMIDVMKKKFNNEELCKLSPDFQEYLETRTLTQKNFVPIMRLLLQMEDMRVIEQYYQLIQRDVKFTQKYTNKFQMQIQAKGKIKMLLTKEGLVHCFSKMLIIPECPVTKSLKSDFFLKFLLKGHSEFIVPGKNIGQTYLAEVEEIEKMDVCFKTSIKLPDLKCSFLVIFMPSRITLRHQYMGLSSLAEMPVMDVERFFFPSKMTTSPLRNNIGLNFHNPLIAKNPEQVRAVETIVGGKKPQLAPFIIFGPPGTGKTAVIVEAILQLMQREPQAKILVTASPNSSCDEIGLRLCKALSLNHAPRPNILARVYCWSQENRRENKNPLLLEYSNMYDLQFIPDVSVLHTYRIVLCTLIGVSKLCLGGFGNNEFTHIFFDEAAASTEPEAMSGLTCILKPNTKLIVAGDHKQLGPIVPSERALSLGLGKSMMERLLERDCYHVDEKLDSFDQSLQSRLTRNYRSHPAIVKLFSHLFYDNKLIASAIKDEVIMLCSKWERLPNPDFPIIFHSVTGVEVFEHETLSFYNENEANQVMDYVNDLLENGINGRKITENDIGIIAPYRSQFEHIQSKLYGSNLYSIETGSVETFRGKEKPIIIVSLVRSAVKGRGLYFIKNKKRTSIILSRAKALLIIVGNANIRHECPSYNYIIDNCVSNKTFVGAPLSEKAQKKK